MLLSCLNGMDLRSFAFRGGNSNLDFDLARVYQFGVFLEDSSTSWLNGMTFHCVQLSCTSLGSDCLSETWPNWRARFCHHFTNVGLFLRWQRTFHTPPLLFSFRVFFRRLKIFTVVYVTALKSTISPRKSCHKEGFILPWLPSLVSWQSWDVWDRSVTPLTIMGHVPTEFVMPRDVVLAHLLYFAVQLSHSLLRFQCRVRRPNVGERNVFPLWIDET